MDIPKNTESNSLDKFEIQNDKILKDDSDNFGFDVSNQGFHFENSSYSLLPDYNAPRSVQNFYSKKKIAKDEEEILQKRDEVLILNQSKEEKIDQEEKDWDENEIEQIDEVTDVKDIKITDWVYVYGLPYELPNVDDTRTEMDSALSRISGYQTISEVKLYQYKDFIDINEEKMSIEVPEGFEKYFDPIALKKSRMLEKNGYQNVKLEGSDEFEAPDYITNNTPINMMYNTDDHKRHKANETIKQAKKLFNNSENIIGSIEEGRRKKLDKSYALVKLDSKESKQKLIRPDLRAFGVMVNNNLCKVEDADYKISLSLYNLPYGISVKEVCDFLNEKIEYKIAAIKNQDEENKCGIDYIPDEVILETNRNDLRKLLIKFSLVLRLKNLETAIFLMDNLNGIEFNERPIKLNLMFGSLKSFGEVFYETVDNETNKVLMNRINMIKTDQFRETIAYDTTNDFGNEKNIAPARVTNYSKLKDRIINKELEENYGSIDKFIEYNWMPEDDTELSNEGPGVDRSKFDNELNMLNEDELMLRL